MPANPILGIDLGTTHTAFAVYAHDQVELIPNAEGERTTPSVVAVRADETVVGSMAKKQAANIPDRTFQSIKRHMGNRDWSRTIDDEEYTPEYVSALILQKVKEDAEAWLERPVDRAVITAPAYFTGDQREATKNAGNMAGFDRVDLLDEPVAACFEYAFTEAETDTNPFEDDPEESVFDDGEMKTIMVCDLGGGTFDVSVVEFGGEIYNTKLVGGSATLGGDDWEEVLLDILSSRIQRNHNVTLSEHPNAYEIVKAEARDLKHRLSSQQKADAIKGFVPLEGGGSFNLDETIDRATFEDASEHLLEELEACIRETFSDPGAKAEENISMDDVDDVVLVGGATRMPMVAERVAEVTGMNPKRTLNPDEAVAKGAALKTGELSGAFEHLVHLEVTPLSLGLEVKEGAFEPIIPKNTHVPTEETKTFTTAQDNQTTVNIRVFQGGHDVAEKNTLLRDFQLTGIPPAPAGVPQIEVTFSIDENNILSASATDLSTGKSEQIRITDEHALTEDELEDFKRRIEDEAEADQMARRRMDARERATRAMQKGEYALNEHVDAIPQELQVELQVEINELAGQMREDTAPTHEIEGAVEHLEDLLSEIGKEQEMAAHVQDDGPPTSSGEGETGTGGDDESGSVDVGELLGGE